MLIIVGTSAVPRRAISSMQVEAQPGAVLHRVDPGPHHDRHRLLGERVRRDPGAGRVRRRDGRGHRRRRPRPARGRRRRGRSSRRPASPSRCRPRPAPVTVGGHVGRADLDPDVAQVALAAGRRAGRPGPVAAAPGRRRAPGTGTASRRRGWRAPRRPGRSRPAPGPRRATSIGAPPRAMPMWQCASTRPGRTNPPSASVSAPGTGSKVTRSPTSQRSRTSSSGSTTPRTCNAMCTVLPDHAADRLRSRSGVAPAHAPVWLEAACRRLPSLLKSSFGSLKPGGRPWPPAEGARVQARRELRHAAREAAAASRPRRRAAGRRPWCPCACSSATWSPCAGHAGQAHHAAHLLHHLLRVGEAVEQLVDVHHGDAGAVGDAGPAGAVDDLRVAAARPGSSTG